MGIGEKLHIGGSLLINNNVVPLEPSVHLQNTNVLPSGPYIESKSPEM